MQSRTSIIELLVSLWFRAALASEASSQRGHLTCSRAGHSPDPGLVGARS
jgi:hypothetical protein